MDKTLLAKGFQCEDLKDSIYEEETGKPSLFFYKDYKGIDISISIASCYDYKSIELSNYEEGDIIGRLPIRELDELMENLERSEQAIQGRLAMVKAIALGAEKFINELIKQNNNERNSRISTTRNRL